MDNSRLRFRVWDNVDYMSSPFTLHDLQTGRIQFTDYVEVMQYIGIKDKNKTEIYEGDVIVVNWNDARYKPTTHVVKWDEQYLEYALPGGCPASDASHFEVIGNIHQNPELIKQQPCQTDHH